MEHTDRELSELNRITKETDEVYRKAAKALQLSDCAFWILYALRDTDTTLTQRDICTMFFQPKQTVNSALKKLEADGYLSQCHTMNHKSKAIQLTARGRALVAQTIDRVRERELLALQELTDEERQTFLHLSRKFSTQLKKHMQSLDGDPSLN